MTKLKNFLPYYLYLLFHLPYLLVVAPLSFKGREIIRTAAHKIGFDRRYFGLMREAEFPMPAVAADTIDGVDFGFSLLHPNSHDGSVSTYEIAILNKLVTSVSPKLIVEFGTFDGRTALNFAANAPQAQVVTIDFDPQPRLFDGRPEAKNIKCVIGNSTTFDTTPYRGKADFIFVDGGHDEPIVTNDTLKAFEMIAPDGVIAWHDYRDFRGVQEALKQGIERYGSAKFRYIKDTTMVVFRPQGFGPSQERVMSKAA